MNNSSVDLRSASTPVLTFPALAELRAVSHGFIGRVPGVHVTADRAEALKHLEPVHKGVLREALPAENPLILAEQTHGNGIAHVRDASVRLHPGCDGLITNVPNLCLGIYVADCAAVFLVDPVRRAIGLVHSGKKGTALGITGRAIEAMREHFQSKPEDLVVCLGPCIRPPEYEVDFAAEILASCKNEGVHSIYDCGFNTGADVGRWYSYRMEKGKTGRMLAWLCLAF